MMGDKIHKDSITKAMLFNGKAIVSIIDIKDIADYACKCQKLTAIGGTALARVLAYTAFLSAGMKGTAIKLSITFDGDGDFGKIITAGSTGGLVRGYVENRDANPETIAKGIGAGSLSVIKDFGLKDPYNGRVELARSDIDSDFAYYFNISEQLNTACISGAVFDNDSCKCAGAIIVQSMPNCDEETLFVLEDIVSNNFGNVTELLQNKTPEEIIDYNFGHFDCKIIDVIHPLYKCTCSHERVESMVKALGRSEAEDIIRDNGTIEVHCEFCNTYYRFGKKDLDKLFGSR